MLHPMLTQHRLALQTKLILMHNGYVKGCKTTRCLLIQASDFDVAVDRSMPNADRPSATAGLRKYE